MSASLVGSEMCIRDRPTTALHRCLGVKSALNAEGCVAQQPAFNETTALVGDGRSRSLIASQWVPCSVPPPRAVPPPLETARLLSLREAKAS
eukprot:10764318-Alexandrium_andersonii.AAC.1